jgi:hypothetical protein
LYIFFFLKVDGSKQIKEAEKLGTSLSRWKELFEIMKNDILLVEGIGKFSLVCIFRK